MIFFNADLKLPEEMASTCEGEITLAECTKALSMMQNNKSPGSDGLTTTIIIKYLYSAYTFQC